MVMRGATSNRDDPAHGLRVLLAGLLVLALLGGVGALVLSARGSSAKKAPRPALFTARFSEPGFLSGEARLVTSYDAAASSRELTGSVDVRGPVYVVARCATGTVRVAVGALTSTRPCTGSPVGIVALNIAQRATLTATVNSSQSSRWGVAIYR